MTSTSFNKGYSLSRNSSKVIQPPGGQTADIFGRGAGGAYEPGYSSASSQAGSDVASSRVHIETDQQSIASSNQTPIDGMIKQQPMMSNSNGQMSPTGSVGSSSVASGPVSGQQQQLLMADDFKPTQQQQQQQQLLMADDFKPTQQQQQQQQQQIMNQQASSIQQALNAQDASRTPKKTIPVLRRNPITGEILENPVERPTVVRVRQPPGGRSSGIF